MKKVLLVDDEEDFVSALAERLRIRKYDVKVATNGETALREISKERPDIVLLDLKMPGLSGMDTLRRIVTQDPTIDVIMMTGALDSEAGPLALEAGAVEHIVKPLDLNDLEEKFKEIGKKDAASIEHASG